MFLGGKSQKSACHVEHTMQAPYMGLDARHLILLHGALVTHLWKWMDIGGAHFHMKNSGFGTNLVHFLQKPPLVTATKVGYTSALYDILVETWQNRHHLTALDAPERMDLLFILTSMCRPMSTKTLAEVKKGALPWKFDTFWRGVYTHCVVYTDIQTLFCD